MATLRRSEGKGGVRPTGASGSEQKQGILIPAVSPSAVSRPALRGLKALPEKLLTVAEVAEAMGVCRATVYALCDRGELPHVRVSNAIRFSGADLERFLRLGRR